MDREGERFQKWMKLRERERERESVCVCVCFNVDRWNNNKKLLLFKEKKVVYNR